MTTTTQHKPGYKKTKLGWIPEEWQVCTFIEIADKKVKWSFTGGPFGSDLKSEHYTEDGVRIIQLQNIGDGKFKNKYKIFTSEEKANQLLGCNIYPGDLILSKMGDPVTRTCLIPDFHDRYVMGSDGIRLVPDLDKFDKIFVKSYLNYSIFRNIAIRHSTGSTRQRIGLLDLKKLPFPLPPLKEQQKIATILTTWDNAINKQQQLITQKRHLKKGLMQQLLTGKVRFDGFTEEWKEVKLGDVLTLGSGKTKPINTTPEKNKNNRIAVYGGNGVSGYSDSFLEKGEKILIGRVGEYCGCVHYVNGKFWITDNCLYTKTFSSKNHMLFFALLLEYLKLDRFRNKGGQPLVSQKPIMQLKIKRPSLIEQQKIASGLTAADAEIEKLQTQLASFKLQKKGLMQQLLTGKTRVKLN